MGCENVGVEMVVLGAERWCGVETPFRGENIGGETAVSGARMLVEKRPFGVMRVGGETAVNGGGAVASGSLFADEVVYLGEGNGRWGHVTDTGHKLFQVAAIISKSMSLGISPPDPIDKAFDFIQHNRPPTA